MSEDWRELYEIAGLGLRGKELVTRRPSDRYREASAVICQSATGYAHLIVIVGLCEYPYARNAPIRLIHYTARNDIIGCGLSKGRSACQKCQGSNQKQCGISGSTHAETPFRPAAEVWPFLGEFT